MLPHAPRVAYFPDSFHEVNGVAHTSRHFEAFARRRGLPFLCVRAGDRAPHFENVGNLSTLELKRGPLSFALDKDLRFDPAFARHLPAISRTVRAFRPDLIHITGPSEVGMLGALVAHHLRLPLAASWHTNVHEYAARRSMKYLRRLSMENAGSRAPELAIERATERALERAIERSTLALAARLYRQARVLFAPNAGLCRLLEDTTGRPCHLMPRGVDTELFSPAHRDQPPAVCRTGDSQRQSGDRQFVLGYVGRLSVEKNVALLAEIQKQLPALGITDFRFLIIGQGAQEAWLRAHLPGADMPGVLRGPALSRAYANMDLFVFPSHTDTFGNVVLEALASGVPAIVTPDGGPRSIVREGETGFIAEDGDFASACARVLGSPCLHQAMRIQARVFAKTASWDAVFEGVYAAYSTILEEIETVLP